MRKWEEIVKDKLEGYESPLPEGHLADFRARREQACKPRRRFPWVGAVALAVAASLSAFLFLWKPAVPEGNIRVAESMPNPGLLVSDSAEVSRPLTRPVWSGAQASDGEVSTAENRGVQALAGKTSEAEARQAAAASETVPPSDTAEAAAHAEAAQHMPKPQHMPRRRKSRRRLLRLFLRASPPGRYGSRWEPQLVRWLAGASWPES